MIAKDAQDDASKAVKEAESSVKSSLKKTKAVTAETGERFA